VFDPLSNETRLKIVDRLKDGERCYWTGVILCIGDPAPSRMAEALVPSMRDDAVKELGVETHWLVKERPRVLRPAALRAVTVRDRSKETCSIVPSASRLRHWHFETGQPPLETQRRDVFLKVRD